MCGSAMISRASAICWAWAGVSACWPEPIIVSRPAGQALDPVRGADRAQGGPDRLVAGVLAGEQDVVAHRADEHVVLLGDQGDLGAQRLERQRDELDPADPHRAGARPVDARQQPAQGRLARPGRADDRQPLAGAQREVDAVQHVVALAVGEAQVLADQVGPGGQVGPGHPVLRHLRDAEQPAGRGGADLEPVHLADQPVERAAERLDVQHRRGDLAERGPALAVAVGADDQGQHARGVERDVDDREQQVAQRHPVALGLGRERDVVVAGLHPAARRGRAPRPCGSPRRSR